MMTTILIADQSSVDRMIIGSMLKGYELKYARNDKELFHELELKPDIGFLLLDVSLPSMNCLEILKIIKNDSTVEPFENHSDERHRRYPTGN